MKVIIKNLQKKIPINPTRIKRAVLKAILLQGAKKSGEITVCFLNDKEIKEVNSKFLGKNYVTDVMAFDISENRKELKADIAVSVDTAIRNAGIYKTTPIYETYLYVIHGVLHLLGWDDRTSRQKKLMQSRAERILAGLRTK